jgi:hypothetical protein
MKDTDLELELNHAFINEAEKRQDTEYLLRCLRNERRIMKDKVKQEEKYAVPSPS